MKPNVLVATIFLCQEDFILQTPCWTVIFHWEYFTSFFITVFRSRQVATIIDGKAIASDIKTELKAEIKQWVDFGNRPPKLVAVMVGEDPASKTYIRNKMKAAKFTGIKLNYIIYPGYCFF